MMGTTPATMNTEAVLDRYVRERDPEAFEHLVLRYQGMVYAACRRHLDVAADVEDAVQETFLKLAHKAATIRSNLSAWLYTTALNTAIQAQRRAQARTRHERQRADLVTDEAADPTQPKWEEIGPAIDRALSELSADDRQLLTERFLLGRSAAELANEANVSRVTLHKRLNRSVERLRSILAKRGVIVPAAALMVTLGSVPAEAAPPAALTASLMKIGIAGIGGNGATGTAAVGVGGGALAAAGPGIGLKGLITTGAALLFGGVFAGLLAADGDPGAPSNRQTAAQPGSGSSTATLPDPAVAGPWRFKHYNHSYNVVSFSKNKLDRLRVDVSQPQTVVTREIQGVITAHHSGAEQSTLALTDLDDPHHQPYGKAIYRFVGDQVELFLVWGQNRQQPQQPQSFTEQRVSRWHTMLRRVDQPIDHPQLGRKRDPAFDPQLTGDWYSSGTGILEFTPDGRSLLHSRFTGKVHYELKILEWQPHLRPRRIEGIFVQHQDKRLIGRRMKMIYRVVDDRIEFAYFNLNKPASLKWPRSFTPVEHLQTEAWEREHLPDAAK